MTDSDRDTLKIKTIKLAEWNPNEFILWQHMVSMTFQAYDVWSIVNGSEPIPTPSSSADGEQYSSSNENNIAYIHSLADWTRRNILVCKSNVVIKFEILEHTIASVPDADICRKPEILFTNDIAVAHERKKGR